ncbi:MAG: tryptophan synthase subunit alpha, partial [Pseudomonadota bacterium]
IRLATPTTDAARLPTVIERASGFLYYVAVAGVTGDRSSDAGTLGTAIAALRTQTRLPIAAGFGIKDAASAKAAAEHADAVVVGSAIVKTLALEGLEAALALTTSIAEGVHGQDHS